MSNFFNKFFFTSILVSFLIISIPSSSFAEGINGFNKIFIVTQQKTIINYEKSQPSSIDNPVVDPNFMRDKDTESSTATYIVIGLLIAATIIPLATWWYFSK